MSMKNFFRRDLPRLLIILAALPMLAQRFISDPTLEAINQTMGFWSSMISMIAWGLGLIYLFQGEYHAMKMKPGMTQKFLFGVLVTFSLILVVGAFMYGDLSKGQLGLGSPEVQWWYTAFYRSQSTAFYGLMYLYLMSASYRMLRVKSLESSVMLVAGVIYLMANTSIFTLYAPWLIDMGEWLFNYPNNAATTAAVMAMAMGSVLIGIRQLLGRERTAVEVAD